MKIVVIGGTGLIGSKVVARLAEHGHEAVAASPNTGVNTLTGEGLAEVLTGAAVVVDVSNSPSFEDVAVLEFFETSTRNLLDAEATAGVAHHVALSVVGTERLPDSGYIRAKVAQEKLITSSAIPYSIVHATQFFEFVTSIADGATDRRRRAPSARAVPADRGRRCRRRRWPRSRRRAAQRHARDRRAGGVPLRRPDRATPSRSATTPCSRDRSARALLRDGVERTLARTRRRRAARHDPLRRLAQPAGAREPIMTDDVWWETAAETLATSA